MACIRRVVGRAYPLAEAGLSGRIVDLSQLLLQSLDDGIELLDKVRWERPGKQFHLVAQLLGTNPESVQGRGIRVVGRCHLDTPTTFSGLQFGDGQELAVIVVVADFAMARLN